VSVIKSSYIFVFNILLLYKVMDFKNLQNNFLNYWRENGPKSLLGYKKSGQLFYELIDVLSL